MAQDIVQTAIESGDRADAIEAIKEIDLRLGAIEDSQERASLRLNKAVFCGILKRFEEARQELRRALEEAPTDLNHLQVDFIRGSLYDQEGALEESVVHLTAVLSDHAEELTHPEYRFIYEDIQQRRGFDLARLRRFREAIPVLEECLSFNLTQQSRSDILVNLGLCHLQEKAFQRAKDCLEQAIMIGLTRSFNQTGHFYLGLANSHLSLYEEAKREFLASEENIEENGIKLTNIYKWLSYVCDCLGEKPESERYAKLSKIT